MNAQEEKNLQFLRFAINDSAPLPDHLEEMDWQGLYDFAKRHTVMGVVYDGIRRLPEDSPRPSEELELEWYYRADIIRRDNIRLNMVAAKLTERLAAKGFRSCVVKGQGNALMYREPYLRHSGDIDIWLEGSRSDIFKMVKKDVPTANNQFHHIDYPVVQGVEIEIHYVPSYYCNFFYNHRLQKYYRSVADEQFEHWVELPDSAGRICRPTDAMNRIQQLSHVHKHFVNGGVGLRQLIDYYYLLRRGFSEEERAKEEELLKRLNMLKFARAMMYVQHEIFGLEERYLTVPPDERIGKKLIEEVLQMGNFGRSDARFQYKGKNRVMLHVYRTARAMRYWKEFPSEALLRPVFLVWHQFWKCYQWCRYRLS